MTQVTTSLNPMKTKICPFMLPDAFGRVHMKGLSIVKIMEIVLPSETEITLKIFEGEILVEQYGGEEFHTLFLTPQRARKVARILQKLAKEIESNGKEEPDGR